MQVSGGSHKFVEQLTEGVDANTSAATPALDVSETLYVIMEVRSASGAHTTHVITLQCSLDGIAWTSTSHTVTGPGLVEGLIHSRYCRAKVTTPEGGASTVDIALQGK